jgi:hypothetical protein
MCVAKGSIETRVVVGAEAGGHPVEYEAAALSCAAMFEVHAFAQPIERVGAGWVLHAA